MAIMFGRFDIQSEISKSETALIYKATDTETNQVVALKTQSLAPLGDRVSAFVDKLIAEGESTRELASQNIVVLYGAGQIEGQFCAAMEYIQGNSIATMLARKEGFSIWDLLDITRQVCAALGKAAALGVVHSSLEPAKIMVQWDGLVKVLGYGISNMSLIEAEAGNGLGRLLPYCSPEQIRGEAIDQRSNLYTLGTILYEMAAGRKAFDDADPVALMGQIQNEMPADPAAINPKIQPAVSAVIMKALAKDPAQRYQTARELVEDFEKCKDSSRKAAAEPKKTSAAPAITVDPMARAAAAAKFTTAVAGVSANTGPSATDFADKPPERARAAAASAGLKSSSGARLIQEPEPVSTSAPGAGYAAPAPVSSAAALEQETETHSPRIAADPMMAGAATGQSGTSFSDIDELPPLKEPVFAAAPPEPEEIAPRATEPVYLGHAYAKEKEEKPRVQPREVAGKAFKQIATVPPRLMLFSLLSAAALILVVAVWLFVHVRSEDDGSTAAPKPIRAASAEQPVAPVTAAPPAPQAAPPVEEAQPDVTVRQIERRVTKTQRQAAPPQPAVVPGQAMIDSNPQGAQFQLDGVSDPSWVTPFTLTGLSPGKHIVSLSKTGYTTEVRSVDVVSGSKSSLVLQLSPITALVMVNSTPAGADIILDGKPTGRATPAQFAVEKGTHTLALKKQGFLDETTTAALGAGQNFQYAPTMKPLGNADEIRTVGKFKKLFGSGGDNTVGMGTVSIRTRPRGAQITINEHMLDKTSPVEMMMGPGNYVVDITLTGFKSVHKVIAVEKGGRVAIDEILDRE